MFLFHSIGINAAHYISIISTRKDSHRTIAAASLH